VFFSACTKEKSDTIHTDSFVKIQLTNTINGKPMQLNTNYTNAFHEAFRLTDYKYIISNIKLINPVKNFIIPESYHLIDEKDPSSKLISAEIKTDTYSGISFTIGIDSARQVSNAPLGIMDPSKGMFLDLHLGYMTAKLEGESEFSGAPNHVLRHYIGGFEGRYSSLRHVVMAFHRPITVAAGQTLEIDIKSELLRWFDGQHQMQIIHNPTILKPGDKAMNIADNCSKQFSVSSLQVN
jgi:hypothetical protein